LQHHDSRR